MLKALQGAPQVEIEIYNAQPYYTNGDLLCGCVVINSAKSLAVQKIEIKLRCDEFAYVWVANGQGGYYESEMVRHLSVRRTLFPSQSLANKDAGKAGKYTIQAGVHKFDFRFQLPLGERFPQTIQIKASPSGIKWYLKAAVHRGQMLSSTKRVLREFEMRPFTPSDYDNSASIHTECSSTNMNAYLPGYSAQLKTTAGRLKELFPTNSQYRKRVEVRFSIGLPKAGVLQSPAALPLYLDLSCTDEDLLIVKRFELVLKVKYIVSVNDGWHSVTYRDSIPLLDLKDIDKPFKPAIELIQTNLAETQITGRPPGTFSNKHLDVSYKLVATAIVASRENPTSLENVRTTAPLLLHNYSVGYHEPDNNFLDCGDSEELPVYCEQPQVGELTFRNI